MTSSGHAHRSFAQSHRRRIAQRTGFPGLAAQSCRRGSMDRLGRSWQVAQRRLRPAAPRSSGSHAAAGQRRASLTVDRPEALYPSLVLTVCVPLDPRNRRSPRWAGCSLTLSAGIWPWRRRLSPALAQGTGSADAYGRVGPRTERRPIPAGLWRGWDRRRARRPGTGIQRPSVAPARRLPAATAIQQRCLAPVANAAHDPDRPDRGRAAARTLGDEYRRVLKSALGKASQLGEDRRRTARFSAAPTPMRSFPTEKKSTSDTGLTEYLADQPASTGSAEIVHHRLVHEPLPVRVHRPLLGQLAGKPARQCAQVRQARILDRCRDLTARRRSRSWPSLTTGPGIAGDEIDRVFEPFYRTRTGRRPDRVRRRSGARHRSSYRDGVWRERVCPK